MMKKNQISKYYLFILLSSLTFLTACQSQSTPKVQQKGTAERPLNALQSPDGVQNIRWSITDISAKKALFFQQQPYIQFNSRLQTLQGSTGCNSIFGKYEINNQKASLRFTANASHQSCDHALAQEAELMQALQQVQSYQVQGNIIRLLDARGQTLVTAKK